MFKDIYEEGRAVILMPYDINDLEDLCEAYSDPNVMELCTDGTTSKEWVSNLIQWMVHHCYENNTPKKIEKFGVSIKHKQSGKIIGWCGLGSLDCDPSEIELFFGLNSQYWRQGYGLEAAQLMLRYGFHVIGLSRIVAVVKKSNYGSRRIIDKLHMKFEKVLKITDPNLMGYDGMDLLAVSKEEYERHYHKEANPMKATLRTYQSIPRFGEDYNAIRDFLLRIDNHNYPFGRWDWMITHGYLDESGLERIGLWEEGGELVGLATYDCNLGQCYLMTHAGSTHLKEAMLLYAKENLRAEGLFRVVVQDGDLHMQTIAAKHGFRPTQHKECDSVLPLDVADLSYTLPEGFRIVSMAEELDYYKYGQVLWKGFNHEANGEGPFVLENSKNGALGFERPNVNLDLKIAVAAPNGDFVSYCGMWQDAASPNALVEPVATDPAYRKMGLGRAAVLEACRRCRDLGAQRAFVGSSQQFYYSIGFWPYATSTVWEETGGRNK